jgi:hypothetical protein
MDSTLPHFKGLTRTVNGLLMDSHFPCLGIVLGLVVDQQ